MMNFDEILNNADDCICKLFELNDNHQLPVRFLYLQPFWNYIKYRINKENLNWKKYFCEESMLDLRQVYLSNLDLWSDKTILNCIKSEIDDLCTYNKYKRIEQYSVKQYSKLWKQYSPDFPEMIRLILIWTEDFIQHVTEIVTRISDSYDELSKVIFHGNVGKVLRIGGGVSDLHAGRCVQIVTFENGSKVVYKPRSIKLDFVWNGFLDFLTEKAGIGRFPTYQCILHDSYGFAEFVETSPVKEEKEFEEFFFNCGFLLGAVYFLQGSDLHSENLLACGKYPVLIDVETVVRNGNVSIVNDFKKKLKPFEKDSVRKSNLLPFLSPFKYLKPGSDAFTSVFFDSKNLPYTADGATRSGRQYSNEIVNGFSLCYDITLKYCRDIFAEGGVLYDLKDCEIRILLRNTSEYARYLSLLSNKECLQDSSRFEEKLNNLRKLYYSIAGEDRLLPKLERFINEERNSLTNGYIPRFSIRVNEELPCDEPYKTCQEYLVNKHAHMNEMDKKNQCDVIMKCLSENKAYDGCNNIVSINADEFKRYDYEKELSFFMEKWINRWEKIIEDKVSYGYVVERDNYYFYYTKLEYAFSEGFLGIVPALSAWYQLTKNEKTLKILERISSKIIAGFKFRAPSIFGEGLVDGLDGICLIANKAFEMTGLTSFETIYKLSFEAILNKKVKKTYYSEKEAPSLYYSQTASIFVLSMCAGDNSLVKEKLEELVSVQLEQIKSGFKADQYGLMKGMDGIILALRSAQPYLYEKRSKEIDDYFNDYRKPLVSEPCSDVNYSVAKGLAGHLMVSDKGSVKIDPMQLPFLKNISFALGSAGIIYALDKAAIQQSEEYANRLLKDISSNGILANQPSLDPFPSFQYGEGGIVYSLIHHLNSKVVTSIF